MSVMTEEMPTAGPSRPRRAPDLADRIISLQRKNASASGPIRAPISRRSEVVDEYSRGHLHHGGERMLYDPSRPPSTSHHHHAVSEPRRHHAPHSHRHQQQYSSRGDMGPPPLAGDDRSRRHHAGPSPLNGYANEGRSSLMGPPSGIPRDLRDARSTASSSSSSRQLFDPSIHDPMHFGPRVRNSPQPMDAMPLPGPSSRSGSSTLLRRPVTGRTPEEEADRERERRRRREGSERGSSMALSSTGSSRRKESDGKSRGSRSSEGSESFKDRERGKGRADTGVKAVLKDIHDKIKTLETELTEMHRVMSADPEAGISVLLDERRDAFSRDLRPASEDAGAWLSLMAKHKELADLHHDFLVRVFDPLVPASMHQLTTRYNIPSRLWQVGFHLILERLRYAWLSGHPTALDLLTDFVHESYKFYSDMLEDVSLSQYRTAWIEALGDLARYRMAIATHLAEEAKSAGTVPTDTRQKGHTGEVAEDDFPEDSGMSIGAAVAESWDVEDKETWRTTASDWYNMGITEKPGEGRLHHHLALLSRDVRGQEARALHHFVKSLTVTHAYETSRESILPLFDAALQSQRSMPEAGAMDLFVRLHGMLFTKIALDDFPPVLSRFMERLEEDAQLDSASRKANISQVDWMIMASVNIGAVLQYGSSNGIIRKALAQEGADRRRAQAQAIGSQDLAEDGGEGEDGDHEASGGDGHVTPRVTVSSTDDDRSPTRGSSSSSSAEPFPVTMEQAVKLAFAVLEFAFKHPYRQQGVHQVLNPYITVFLTFLATLGRQPHVSAILSPYVPWTPLVEFINRYSADVKEETKLATGPPLPEDWTIRGEEWVGRRVFERGFWKSKSSSGGSGGGRNSGSSSLGAAPARPRTGGDRFASEMDVLVADFDAAVDISEGVVDEADGTDMTDGPVAVNQRRWKRVAWAAGVMLKHVAGLAPGPSGDGVAIVDPLKHQLEALRVAEEARQADEDARRARATRDENDVLESSTYDSDDEDYAVDNAELAALRDKHSRMRSMLQQQQQSLKPSHRQAPAAAVPAPLGRKSKPLRNAVRAVAGYTMLIFDTNVVLSGLDRFKQLVEGGHWSVIVPLPVVTELDGLSKSAPPLGPIARSAISFLESHIRTHALSLKVQTSKGNYLSDLLIRTERTDAVAGAAAGQPQQQQAHTRPRTMDDLILDAASFQAEHWQDRSALLARGPTPPATGAAKVVLVTDDRNLRLKARSRGVEAVDEKELVSMLGH